jgi:predicted O-linked N-acetylglucosamine transferase (SPINDLY family)
VLSLAGVDPARLVLLPQQATREHVHAVLRVADLYLDSFPFSGAVSILDPLEAELPLLLMQGNQARCRQSAGMHAEFRLPAELVETPEAYLQKALELSHDPAALARLKAEAAPCKARMKAGRMKLADSLYEAFQQHMQGLSAKV